MDTRTIEVHFSFISSGITENGINGYLGRAVRFRYAYIPSAVLNIRPELGRQFGQINVGIRYRFGYLYILRRDRNSVQPTFVVPTKFQWFHIIIEISTEKCESRPTQLGVKEVKLVYYSFVAVVSKVGSKDTEMVVTVNGCWVPHRGLRSCHCKRCSP